MMRYAFFCTAPPIFQALLGLIRPLLSPLTSQALFIYGNNKQEWQKALLAEIESNQLAKAYGGLREQGFEPHEVKEWKELRCNRLEDNVTSNNNSSANSVDIVQ